MNSYMTELLKVLEDYLKNPPPLTNQEVFVKRFIPLHRLMIEATDFGESDFFLNVDYTKFSLDDLAWISYLLSSVPSMDGDTTLEDVGEEQVWLHTLLKQESGDIDYEKTVRRVPAVRHEELYF